MLLAKSPTLRITFCLLLLFLAACSSDSSLSPEQQVKATLAAVESAAEARSLSGVMEHVSDDYADHQANTKDDIQRLVQFQILRNQKINVFTVIQSIEINDGLASVELSAAMSAREVDLSNEANRLRADLHHFSLVLIKQDQEWLISSVSWRQGW